MHPDKFLQRRKGATQAPRMSDEDRAERLQSLGTVIATKRREAVDARKASGIEAVWMSCEEAYLGIDDTNRHEFSEARWAKPTSMTGPLTSSKQPVSDGRSNAFVRLTSRYVDHGAAKLGEILLPIDDKAFSFSPTPDADPVLQVEGGAVVQPTPQPTPAPQPGQPAAPAQPDQSADPQQQIQKQAEDCATRAETRIYDWMVDSNYPAEARKVIHDAARIGVGVLKGPYPDIKESRALSQDKDALALQIKRKIIPALKWIDPWNLFPADGCGEDIHSGDDILERDFISAKQLRKLKNDPDYLPSQIDLVLAQGPGKVFSEGVNPKDQKARKAYEIWYYYGTLKREDFEPAVADPELLKDIPADQDEVFAIVSLVNDTVIRAVLNPLDSGAFPYRVMTWTRRPGSWAGVGVGEQMWMPQRAVNAATRALFNNAGVSAGVQIVIDQLGVTPADGKWTITPNKIWYKTGESSQADVRAAFAAIEIPNVTSQLMVIIQYGMKLAEECTGIPLVTQGQVGDTTPQTFGQAELQDNNAHTWLRTVGYRYDDQITDPLVQDLYEWLLLDPEVPDDEKGDFNIDAHGSVAMIEKAIQEQTYAVMLNATLNPAFKQDPAKWFAQLMKSKRMNPALTEYSPEDLARMQNTPPPKPPQVQVAEINAQAKLHAVDMQIQGEMQQSQAEMQHEQNLLQTGGATPAQASATARIEAEKIKAAGQQSLQELRSQTELTYAATEAQMARDNANAQIQMLQVKRELALLEYATQQKISLDQVKADLAKTAMIEQTKRQLGATEQALLQSENDKDRAVDLHKHSTPPASLVRDQMSTEKTP